MTDINRANYNIFYSFPKIRDFPMLKTHDESTAVLMRLFGTMLVDKDQYEALVNFAIWNMRAHIINSDIQEYRPRILFHIEASLFEVTRHIFEDAGVPQESILIFPNTLFHHHKKPVHPYFKAAAPFVDPQLDKYERVIVLDADSLSLSSPAAGLSPLMDISLNHMPTDHITMLRGWTVYSESQPPAYNRWLHDSGDLTKDEWINRIARLCNAEPSAVHDVLYPQTFDITPRPEHNGSYIHIPMHLLRDNSELRSFIRDTSISMGHEEIALAIWSVKTFLETNKRLPYPNLCDFDNAPNKPQLKITLSLFHAWTLGCEGIMPSFVHIHGLEQLDTFAYDFAKHIGSNESDASQFADTITSDYNQLRTGHALFDIHGRRL